jgi:hypothetical protein
MNSSAAAVKEWPDLAMASPDQLRVVRLAVMPAGDGAGIGL